MKIIPLGTNGFFPSFGRQTACYAIPYKKTLIILDAGSGLFRLVEPVGKKLLAGIDEVHLYLSHYHLDHTFGFYAAFNLFKRKKVTVFGPKSRKVFEELVKLGYFPVDYKKEHANFIFKSLDRGENKLSSYKVYVRNQDHRGEVSIALRFSFGLAYTTDGLPENDGIEFVRDVQVLLQEGWFAGEDINRSYDVSQHIQDGHVTVVGAALIAKKADVGKLVLIHHNPYADEHKLKDQLQTAQSIFPQSTLANDGKTISF